MAGRRLFIERRYERADGRGKVRLSVYQPFLDKVTGDYCCRVEVRGLAAAPEIHEAWGVDAMQALVFAVQGLNAWMEPHRRRLRWMGGTWLGLPIFVPQGLGERIDARLESAVDREMRRIVTELEHAHHPPAKAPRRRRTRKTA